MFCQRCYADLTRSEENHCPRCGREFDPDRPSTWLARPFPPKWRILAHTLFTLFLATIVSMVVAGVLATQQFKYFNSGH